MHQCPYCEKNFQNYKSWHRHKTLKHNNEIKQLNHRALEYEKTPNHCLKCGEILPFAARHNEFCSKSCAASVNNVRYRDKRSISVRATWDVKAGGKSNKTIKRERQIERLERVKLGLPSKRATNKSPRTYNKSKTCPTCSTTFQSKGSAHTYCHPKCNGSKASKVLYRQQCKFSITPQNHPQLFDFDLIKTNGWYRAANHPDGYNPDGVTWDHLFRVEDGYKNGVDPSILAHPANAQMVTWRENQKRKKSSITLEELLQRIELWNKL